MWTYLGVENEKVFWSASLLLGLQLCFPTVWRGLPSNPLKLLSFARKANELVVSIYIWSPRRPEVQRDHIYMVAASRGLTTSRMTGMVNSFPGHSYLSAMKCSDQLRYFDSAVLFSKFLNWFGDHSTYRGPVKAPYINQFHEPSSENRPPLLLKAMLPTEHTKREIGML